MRLTHPGSGQTIETESPDAYRRQGWVEATAPGYSGLKVPDLKAEVDRRNEGRDADSLIPSDGNKADLIAALEADDSK